MLSQVLVFAAEADEARMLEFQSLRHDMSKQSHYRNQNHHQNHPSSYQRGLEIEARELHMVEIG